MRAMVIFHEQVMAPLFDRPKEFIHTFATVTDERFRRPLMFDSATAEARGFTPQSR
jgi:hypothetical protein